MQFVTKKDNRLRLKILRLLPHDEFGKHSNNVGVYCNIIVFFCFHQQMIDSKEIKEAYLFIDVKNKPICFLLVISRIYYHKIFVISDRTIRFDMK